MSSIREALIINKITREYLRNSFNNLIETSISQTLELLFSQSLYELYFVYSYISHFVEDQYNKIKGFRIIYNQNSSIALATIIIEYKDYQTFFGRYMLQKTLKQPQRIIISIDQQHKSTSAIIFKCGLSSQTPLAPNISSFKTSLAL